jgi:hypothetical protein
MHGPIKKTVTELAARRKEIVGAIDANDDDAAGMTLTGELVDVDAQTILTATVDPGEIAHKVRAFFFNEGEAGFADPCSLPLLRSVLRDLDGMAAAQAA